MGLVKQARRDFRVLFAADANYEGGGALFRLATSAAPDLRAHYDRLAQFILQRQKQADGQSSGQP